MMMMMMMMMMIKLIKTDFFFENEKFKINSSNKI